MARHMPAVLTFPIVLGLENRAWLALEDVLGLLADGKHPVPAVTFPEPVPLLHKFREEAAVFGMIAPAVAQSPSLMTRELPHVTRSRLAPVLVWGIEMVVVPGARVFILPDELATSHAAWEAYRRSLRSPGQESPQEWTALRKAVEEPTGLFSAVYFKPRLQRLLEDTPKIAARRQLGRTALAATAYRQKHGKYPERLEELVPAFLPAMPVDPCDGQVLRLKRFPDVTVLYTQQHSPGLESESSWDPARHAGEPIFLLRTRAATK
jgi:hypothetical protein